MRAKDARREAAVRRRERDARHAAAKAIQSRQRRKQQLREEREAMMQRAATTIQSRWRARLAWVRVQALRVASGERSAAARLLQGCQRRKWRRRAEAHRLASEAARRDAAAAKLQGRYRGGVGRSVADRRRRKRDESLAADRLAAARGRAATTIQAHWRGKSARLSLRMRWRMGKTVSGLKWERHGKAKPLGGMDVSNNLLRDALRRTNELTKDILVRCKLPPKGLRADCFILVDKVYLVPVIGKRAGAGTGTGGEAGATAAST